MDELKQLLDKQKERIKENHGTLATSIWVIFTVISIFRGQIAFISWESLLMFFPGIFVGATAIIIPYYILFEGTLVISKRIRISPSILRIIGWVIKIIDIMFIWLIAFGYLELVKYLLN